MFAARDRFQDFVDLVWARTSKQHGFEREDQCSGVLWGRRQRVSFAEGVKRMVDGADGYKHIWSAWCRQNMADSIPPKLMGALIQAIAEHDPVTACRLYLAEPTLTAAEQKLLWDGFTARQSGNLTTMRAKIESRIIRPARDTGIRIEL